MRAITLWQPWASLVGLGLKHYETRSWSTNWQGKLLIHAAKREPVYDEKQAIIDRLKGTQYYAPMVKLFGNYDFPLGCVVAIADLTACLEMRSAGDQSSTLNMTTIEAQTQLERTVGDWSKGRFAWKLENIKTLPQPVPCRGDRRLWVPTPEVIARVTLAAGSQYVKNDRRQP